MSHAPHNAQESSFPHPGPASGKDAYWRCMEALEAADRRQEFPAGAPEFPDPVSRRHFFRIMSASLLLAGLGSTGCRRPEETRNVAGVDPGYTYGEPQYFATAMPSRRHAVPLRVKSIDGRPIKIEGNPRAPGANGGTDLHAQASILGLYDPDRAGRFAVNQQTVSRAEALGFLTRHGADLGNGQRLAIVSEQTGSPSRQRLRECIEKKLPAARWCEFEALDFDNAEAGASLAMGRPVAPRWQLDQAETILSIDCDFLGAEENAAAFAGQFSQNRSPSKPKDSMNRLYCVESLFTLTGSNADHRLAVPPSMLTAVLARFAMEILGAKSGTLTNLAALAAPASAFSNWIVPCAKDLIVNKGRSLVMAGHRMPLEAHALVAAMNEALGVNGKAVVYTPALIQNNLSMAKLLAELNSGSIDTLVILGGNPAYQMPAPTDWAAAQARAKTVLRWSLYEDETARLPGVHFFPATHYLESWGDARQPDGTILAIQPLIEPLFDGITDLEFLARLAGLEEALPQAIVRATHHALTGGDEAAWRHFLQNGCAADSAVKPVSTIIEQDSVAAAAARLSPGNRPSTAALDVVFYRDAKLDDGRFVNNGWLQELPDPVTKLTWDNAILISPATADLLGLARTNSSEPHPIIEMTLKGRTVRGPVLVQPGMADNTLGLALGYGQEASGRVGRGIGFNAFQIRRPDALHYDFGATIQRTGQSAPLAMTQSHWVLEDHGIIRENTLQGFREKPRFAQETGSSRPADNPSLYPNPLDTEKNSSGHQWGMTIDLNRCIGCSACVIACQSENNIPIVGREMVFRSREMHWLRIDRYYIGSKVSPRSVTQPMLCQHCETAPCESVCPVNATVHDAEGLNVMVYNRCVGSRFCSNNCPFKVRRFNFFDYNRNPPDHLYDSPLASQAGGQSRLKQWLKNPDRGSLPEKDYELARLSKNPEVTLRMRGIMEKCSFCQQRLQRAKEEQLIRSGDSKDTRIPKEFVPPTACQQACPARAIEFGDLSDLQSKAAGQRASLRNYAMFNELNLRPRVTYLARIRNLNPQMPEMEGVV